MSNFRWNEGVYGKAPIDDLRHLIARDVHVSKWDGRAQALLLIVAELTELIEEQQAQIEALADIVHGRQGDEE